MTKSSDFCQKIELLVEQKRIFYLLIRELLTFECVVSNRSPPWANNQKFLPGPNRVKASSS